MKAKRARRQAEATAAPVPTPQRRSAAHQLEDRDDPPATTTSAGEKIMRGTDRPPWWSRAMTSYFR